MATERKEKLIRVLQIIEGTDAKSPINASGIIEKLKDKYNIYTDRRSIYKDIDLLTTCGYEIEKCKQNRDGWYMKRHAFDDWEIKIMMDAVQQAKCITDKEAVDIRKRLLRLTSDRGRQRFLNHIMQKTTNNLKENVVGEYIEEMLEAMFLGKKIQYQYTELDNKLKPKLRKEGKIYTLNLYTIVWSNDNYYMIGTHDNYENLTSYRLDRIRNLKISDLDIIPAKDKLGDNYEIRIQEYISQSVNHFSGVKERITIEYVPDAINNAILKDFAEDARVILRKDGMAEASFTKLDSVTLVGWFVQYGSRYRVIKPEGLRKQVIEEIKKARENYSK